MRRLYVVTSMVWGIVELVALQRSRYHAWRLRDGSRAGARHAMH